MKASAGKYYCSAIIIVAAIYLIAATAIYASTGGNINPGNADPEKFNLGVSELRKSGSGEHNPNFFDIENDNNPIDESEADKPEEVYFNFNYEAVVSAVITSYMYKGILYLPIEELFTNLQIPNSLDASTNIFSGNYLNNLKYEVNFNTRTAKLGDKEVSFHDKEVLKVGRNFYVLPSVFEKIFDIKFIADMNNLNLKLSSPEKMPVLVSC